MATSTRVGTLLTYTLANLLKLTVLTIDPNDAGTVAVDLGERVPVRRIVLAWHRDRYRSPAAGAFVDVARDVCAGFGDLSAVTASAGVA